jgi:hypothetical protein
MFVFIMCTILSLLIDGMWLGATDYGTMRTMTYFAGKNTGGWIFPLTAATFLASLPQMLVWDYSFLHSLGAFGGLVRVILSVTISVGFVWGFATMLWPIIANFFITVIRGVVSAVGRILSGLL